MADLKTLYDEDIVAWSEQQAEALRAAARGGANQLLDWQNLAEEIESLGKSERLALRSQIARIIQHLVKLEHSPATDPRNGWRRSVRQARARIRRVLNDSPSLKPQIGGFIAHEVKDAIELAISDLEDQEEVEPPDLPTLRRISYTEEQVLGDWLPDDRS